MTALESLADLAACEALKVRIAALNADDGLTNAEWVEHDRLAAEYASRHEAAWAAARAVLAEPPKEVAALIERLHERVEFLRDDYFGPDVLLLEDAAEALARLSAQVEAAEKDAERLAKRGQHYRDEMERLSAPVPDIDVAQDDLREILRTVGLSDCARPYSPHEVVQRELLPHLRVLRNVIEKYDGNSNNPYWAEEFNQAMRIARARLDKTVAAPVPAREWIPVGEDLGDDDSDTADAARFRALPKMTLAIVWRRPNPLLGDLKDGYNIESLRVWTDSAIKAALPPPPAADKPK